MNSEVECATYPVFRCSENYVSPSATLACLPLYARGSKISLSQAPFQITFFKIIFNALKYKRSQVMNFEVENAAYAIFRCSENHISRSATLACLPLYARVSQSPLQITFFKIICKALNDQRSYAKNSEFESTACPVFRCLENHMSRSETLAYLRLCT
ncbi:hypothetical protein VNO77_41607 [Canavalia gladiata]|uniref:Uncharacterized protein n=1 Tax=Canavalia gladiata TaxID=3824 RepID=A0AAN9PS55_CANGL